MTQIKINSCPEFPFFGATYPDARCINGYLQDMDDCDNEGNVYLSHEEQHPCPFCNTEEFMQQQKDNEADLDVVNEWIENIRIQYS